MTQLNEQYLCYEGEDIQNKRNKIKVAPVSSTELYEDVGNRASAPDKAIKMGPTKKSHQVKARRPPGFIDEMTGTGLALIAAVVLLTILVVIFAALFGYQIYQNKGQEACENKPWTDQISAPGVKKMQGCSEFCYGQPNCFVYHSDKSNCFLCKLDSSLVSGNHQFPASDDWILIYHQTRDVWFAKEEWSACKTGKFAALNLIKNYRNCDGSYHFKLYYPEMNGFNEWTQTSDPTTSKIVTDFKGLNLAYEEAFEGLKLSGVEALMHGDSRAGFWHYPVGINSRGYKPNFPGPPQYLNITDVQLYIKKTC